MSPLSARSPAARAVGLAGAFALHTAFLVVALAQPGTQPPLKNPAPVQVERDREAANLRGQESAAGMALACGGRSYRGFGFSTGWDGEVAYVGSQTPAERAGIQVGDFIMNRSEFEPDMFPVGHVVEIRVNRSGERMTLRVPVGLICQD